MDEEEQMYVVIEDEEGNQTEFDVLEVIEIEGRRYATLCPTDDDDIDYDDEGNAKILVMGFEINPETGDDVLVTIDDDDEFETVVGILESMFDDGDDHSIVVSMN